eukprot:scaffold250_cov110-Isochrysis_galbana.AAC.19
MGAASPMLPLSTAGARPCVASSSNGSPMAAEMGPCHNSDSGHPAAAIMARRACFTSASRIHATRRGTEFAPARSHQGPSILTRPSGSKPTSAA